MILRTPPPRKRKVESRPPDNDESSPAGHLVIYEDDPSQLHTSPQPSDHYLCTYQCRQLVKADLLDNFSSMEKSVADYQSKLMTLSENLVKAEAEGKKYRDDFLYAEQELAAARGREQALQDKFLKEINESQERLKNQFKLCNELEVKLKNEESMRKSSESAAAAAQEKVNLLERKLKQLSDSTERDKKNRQDDLMHLKSDSKLSISRLKADLEKAQCQAVNAEKESKLLKEKLEDISQQLKKCLSEKNELENEIRNLGCPKVDTATQNDVLVKHLQEELRIYESEMLELRKLKESHENIELLKEKLLEEKGHRERVEAELVKLQEVQLSMKVLEDELSSWKKIIKDIPGVESSSDILLKFVSLQKEVINNMDKLGEANTRLKQLEVALQSAELDKQSTESELALAKEKAESLKLENKELKSRLSSVIEERDQLRTFNELKEQGTVDSGNEAIGRNFVQGLDASLAQKDIYIKELESNLCEQKAANDRHHNEIGMLNEKLTSEARKIKSLEREGDRLRSEIALLESKVKDDLKMTEIYRLLNTFYGSSSVNSMLGHGDFSVSNTKVLRMVNALGVESEARQTIEALQCELQKANEKLKVVEELKKQSADAGQLVDLYISGKIVQLKEQIATLEKREERYKTVFADRISVFRRACCELFGYKIVMDDHQRPNGIPITRFTLQSIYAQSDDEKLEFEYESGNTNILFRFHALWVNEYAKQPDISQQVEIFIRKLNSIPAFTANLTVESFNRRTLS